GVLGQQVHWACDLFDGRLGGLCRPRRLYVDASSHTQIFLHRRETSAASGHGAQQPDCRRYRAARLDGKGGTSSLQCELSRLSRGAEYGGAAVHGEWLAELCGKLHQWRQFRSDEEVDASVLRAGAASGGDQRIIDC